MEKRPYESPRVEVIGDVAVHTLALTTGNVYDGGPFTLIPHQPPIVPLS